MPYNKHQIKFQSNFNQTLIKDSLSAPISY